MTSSTNKADLALENPTIEEELMEVIWKLVNKNKVIDIQRIYNICLKELDIDGLTILYALENLQRDRRIISGKRIIRDILLANPTRKKIYQYLLQRPGARISEIARRINISDKGVLWNIKMLKKYECIKEILIKDTKIYGIDDHSSKQIKLGFFLRNKTTRYIIEMLFSEPTELNKIAELLGKKYTSVYYHIQKLMEQDLILSKLVGNEQQYYLNPIFSELFAQLQN